MNAQTKFTPGPWLIDHSPNIPGVPLDQHDKTRTEIRAGFVNARYRPGVCIGAYIANAADVILIAAAPELYALAEKYASECAECGGTGSVVVKAYGIDPDKVDCPDCADIRATLSKARGES